MLAKAARSLVVPDSRNDPAFAERPSTHALGIGAYSGVPLYWPDGRLYGTLCTLHPRARAIVPGEADLLGVAGRIIMQALALAEERSKVQEALRVRDHFLTAASHDLRTPLAMILGRLERVELRLERGHALEPAWFAEQTAAMTRAAERMLSTVEEITDAAQLQIGQTLALHLTPLDLGAVVQATAGMLAGAATWPGAPVIHVDAPEGLVIEGDRGRLERVVQNLVGNAIKYSPHGTPVVVTLRTQEDAGAATKAMVLTVRDEGVGIPPEELPHLFTHFYRASTAIGIAGTGIGLAGCKAIVEQHGGRITLESAPGAGTTVTVTLPGVAPMETGAAGPTWIEDLAG